MFGAFWRLLPALWFVFADWEHWTKLLLRTIELATYSLLSPLHLKVNVVPYIDKYALEGWEYAGCISCLF